MYKLIMKGGDKQMTENCHRCDDINKDKYSVHYCKEKDSYLVVDSTDNEVWAYAYQFLSNEFEPVSICVDCY